MCCKSPVPAANGPPFYEAAGNLVRIADAGSKNGTILNGKRIDYEDLRDGDDLKLGTLSLRVVRG